MQDQDFVRQLQFTHGFGKDIGWSQRLHIDLPMTWLLLLLSASGLFIIYSASGKDIDIVIRQSVYLLIGFIIMLCVAQIPPRLFMIWSKYLYIIGIMLLLVVLVFGTQSKGAQRWIQLLGVRFQPSEAIKLVMPIIVATYLAKRHLPPSFENIVVSLFIISIPVILIAKQPDLGTSILIGVSGILTLLLAGLRKRLIFSAILFAMPLIYVLWHYIMHNYQKQRVLTFLYPESDPLGAGWNIIQSRIAIGSGGLYGKGWLMGTQSHLQFLPESHTDFIIAVLAEEFGFFGCLALMTIYALIIGRGVFITLNTQTLFNRLLAGSIIITFFVYIFVNIGMVSGILPVVGVPLPLISRGGTSLVTIMIGFGILMSVHTNRSFSRQP
ncbi:MAG: rod shape-determining protein RodA [Candidatus Endonucleobacter bathymodioli]|uniref:Peptidoglycan glycosyltransferase MrdB n=1 Tax=Candidatus Endonucleibacter bathymodioli TaxID=539814 RepID=A0AA90P0D2_9GAMM|nr:rod shape-determining protein RodA [Candidatus Endonucleobacter bathymodioli]